MPRHPIAQADHLAPFKFQKGQPSANPKGRPIGSRAKLAELAVKLLHEDFVEHGAETIRRVRERKPDVYLASVVSLLPKQAQQLNSPFIDLSDEELEQLEQLLSALRAKTVAEIGATERQRNSQHNSSSEQSAEAAKQSTEPTEGTTESCEHSGKVAEHRETSD